LKKIIIETIPHSQQRAENVGDYFQDPEGTWHIKVSDMGDWRMNFLIYLHELIELGITQAWCISEPDIQKFDEMWFAEQAKGLHPDDAEPGFDPRSPYYQAHEYSTLIENLTARELCINWQEYGNVVNEVSKTPLTSNQGRTL